MRPRSCQNVATVVSPSNFAPSKSLKRGHLLYFCFTIEQICQVLVIAWITVLRDMLKHKPFLDLHASGNSSGQNWLTQFICQVFWIWITVLGDILRFTCFWTQMYVETIAEIISSLMYFENFLKHESQCSGSSWKIFGFLSPHVFGNNGQTNCLSSQFFCFYAMNYFS